MYEEAVREAVVRSAAPASRAPEWRGPVLEGIARRRRRRSASLVGAGCFAVAVVVGGIVIGSERAPQTTSTPIATDPNTPAAPTPAPGGDWVPMADSPLSPRTGAAGVWTGEELLVVGGNDQRPCPPGADCAVEKHPSFADGAAYDPATDSWRPLRDAPHPIPRGLAAWSGHEMVILSGRQAFAYDAGTDSWRTLDSPPLGERFTQALVIPTGIVFSSHDKFDARSEEAADSGETVDWLLTPETGQWSPLPVDPFGESYDRSLAWDGERLWLLSMSADAHFGAHAGSASRVAVLDRNVWRVVVGATPPLTYEMRWWWTGERMVVPPGAYRSQRPVVGQIYQPHTGEWQNMAAGPDDPSACQLPAAGVGPDWVAGGGPLLATLDGLTVISAPSCEEFSVPSLATWAGDQLLIWGGINDNHTANSNLGLRWAPPSP